MANRRIPTNSKRGAVKDMACGFLFMAGILLAGSDGSWFPWINLFGLFLFSLVPVLCIPATTRDRWPVPVGEIIHHPCPGKTYAGCRSYLAEPTASGGAL